MDTTNRNEIKQEALKSVVGGRASLNGAAYQISDECIGCGVCADACPFDCIHYSPSARIYVIDENNCGECGTCAADCPVGAVHRN